MEVQNMPKFIENDEIEIGIKATKEFTDREEPRKVFWDKIIGWGF